MNSIKKVDVTISFPNGAVFHRDIVEGTYLQFIKMVKKLSCVNIKEPCSHCQICDQCLYHKITGDGYEGYPGIIFKRSIFPEQIFNKYQTYQYEIYFVGECEKYSAYVDIFFKEYLRYQIFGIDFQIKSINYQRIKNEYEKVTSIIIQSPIEISDFKQAYNNMVTYYNKYYGCNYQLLIQDLNEIDIRDVKAGKYNFNGKIIYKNGFIYKVHFNDFIATNLKLIGIGKYNYLGGGIIETVS